MTEQCYASGINPSAIPGDELDPDAIEAAARALAADGAAVRDAGADVLNDWRGLALHYEAPEAPRLFSVMDPVETNARRFGDDVESVAAALTAYAEEIRPIKASLAAVRADAWAFRSDIASEPEWEYDQDLVDRNTALVGRVNALQVRLWEAERRCANAIRGLYGAPAWRAATSEGDARGYGIDEIPTDAAMPWGSEVQRKDHCPKSAAVGVKRFMWDGVVVDGVWGTVTGLGMLVGIDGSGWSWETMKTSWVGMGSLIGYSGGEWSWGNAGDAWTALGKGLIAYDTWDEDPARAAGGAVFNIATIFLPAGAAVTGTKTAGTAASTAGRAATLFARGARVVDFVDPVALGLMGGRAAVPRIGDLLADMRTATQGLGDSLRVPDAPAVPAVRADLDVPAVALDDAVSTLDGLGGDLPPVRDPDVAAPVPATEVSAPVPQPEPALVAGATPEAPGGLGQGADSLHQPPGATPTTGGGAPAAGGGAGTDPGTATTTPSSDGATQGTTAPGGTGWPETPSPGGVGTPTGTGWPGDAPVSDDVPAGVEVPDEIAGGAAGGHAAAPDTAAMRDFLHDGSAVGDGWHRVGDDPVDPEYGHVRADAGEELPAWAGPPAEATPDALRLGGDAENPWGYDAGTGAPLTEQEWVARYTTADGSVRWPDNGGAVPTTQVVFDDPHAFIDTFGPRMDRVGEPDGTYLGVPPGTSWGGRSILPSALGRHVYEYTLDPQAAERLGVQIHVAEVAPAFGQPGGGIQLVFTVDGRDVPVDTLLDWGVLG